MNKKDIIKAIQAQTNSSLKDCNKFYNAFVFTITDGLKKGEEVVISGLGKFIVTQRKSRQVLNPKTKQMMNIPAKLLPQFKAGKKLKDNII